MIIGKLNPITLKVTSTDKRFDGKRIDKQTIIAKAPVKKIHKLDDLQKRAANNS